MDAPADPPKIPMSLQQLRRNRARQLLRKLALWVGAPTLAALLYFSVIAADQYESISPFIVQTAEQQPSLGLESLLGAVPGAASSRDALAIREYVLSRDVLRKLDADHNFIAHYKTEDADWLASLQPTATFEETYEYYADKVAVDYDSVSGVLTLRVRAFSADKAHEFATAILGYSEAMVNDLAEKARQDSIRFAEKQVRMAEDRLRKARAAIVELQGKGADLNPQESAAAALTIRSQLQGELAKARAELSATQAFMRSDAARVVALRQRVSSLAQQVERENRRMVDPTGGDGMNTALAEFEPAVLEKEFSQTAYASALKSLEVARAEAGRQHRYLATIARPSLPDEATYPRRIYGILTVFFVSIAAFAIGSLLVAALREHARI